MSYMFVSDYIDRMKCGKVCEPMFTSQIFSTLRECELVAYIYSRDHHVNTICYKYIDRIYDDLAKHEFDRWFGVSKNIYIDSSDIRYVAIKNSGSGKELTDVVYHQYVNDSCKLFFMCTVDEICEEDKELLELLIYSIH